jgi:hypothetical protein
MLVTERMQALGDHARSSRQPPLKERKRAKADESAADDDVLVIDEPQIEPALENAPVVSTRDDFSAQADDLPAQIIPHENGNVSDATQIARQESASAAATTESAALAPDAQVSSADDNAAQTNADSDDAEISAAKRAIIHEWENWSALHSDELDDPNVAEYFLRHLEMKRPWLLDFGFQDKSAVVRTIIMKRNDA